MATCEKCGNTYYSRECGNCKRLEYEENLNRNNKIDGNKYEDNLRKKIVGKEPLSEKEKLFRIIRYAIIFIMLTFISVGIAEIYVFNKVIDEAKPYNESMKKSLKTIDKMNEKLYKEIEKMGH